MHTTNRRRLLSLVAALMLIAGLAAGCGQDRGAEETTSTTATTSE